MLKVGEQFMGEEEFSQKQPEKEIKELNHKVENFTRVVENDVVEIKKDIEKIDEKIGVKADKSQEKIEKIDDKVEDVKKDVREIKSDVRDLSRATKTLFKIFTRFHDYLLNHYAWYYDWHTNRASSPTHWAALLLTLAILFYIFGFQLGFFGGNKPVVSAAAGINKMINYQGKLTDTNDIPVADAAYNMKFSIYTDAGGTARVWTCAGTLITPTAISVTVANGIFSVGLGSTGDCTNAMDLDFNTDEYYLGVTVGADAEMTPRKRVGAAGYAYNADTVDGINANATATASNLLPLDANKNMDISDATNTKGILTATSLKVKDTNNTNSLQLVWNEDLTADRILNLLVGAGDRTLTLSGNLTVESASTLNQDLTTDASVIFAGLSNSDANITNVGDIALDTISSDASTTVTVSLGSDAGDDFIVDTSSIFVIEGDNHQVGIGTATPSARLHVLGSTGTVLKVEDSASYSAFLIKGATEADMEMQDSGATSGQQVYRWQSDNGLFKMQRLSDDHGTINGTYMTINSSGYIGIGDTSPAALLTVGNNDLFQVNSSGAIAAVTGYTQGSGNFAMSGTGTFGTGTGTISLNGDTNIAAGKNLALSSGTGTFTQTFTGTASPMTITADSMTTGSGITISVDAISSGKGIAIDSTSTAFAGKLLNLTANGAANGTTRYGAYSSLTGAGTTSTNIAGYFNAQNGTTANYGLIVENGNVGIGTTTPGGTLSVVSSNATGITTSAAINLTANSLTTGMGLYASSTSLTSGSLAYLTVNSTSASDDLQKALEIYVTGANSSPQETYGLYSNNAHTGTSSVNIAGYFDANGSGTTSTNIAGYFTASGATNNYAIIVPDSMGSVGIGTTTPSGLLDVFSLEQDVADTPYRTIGGAIISAAGDYNAGYKFQVKASGQITALAARVHDTSSHTVRLYNSVGTVLASATVTSLANDTWYSTSITPVAVTPGNYYYVSVRTSNFTYSATSTPVTTASNNVIINAGMYVAAVDTYPTVVNNADIYGADVTFVKDPPNSVLMAANSGFVGIGTTSPSAMLHVVQSGTSDYFLKLGDSAAGANRVVVDGDGNVGIGDQTPNHKLHVEIVDSLGAPEAAVYGNSTGTGGSGYGGYFVASKTSVNNFGTSGVATGGGTATNYGIYGYAVASATTNYGVYGQASGAGTNYAGYFSGSVYITGNGYLGGAAQGNWDLAEMTPYSGEKPQSGDVLTLDGSHDESVKKTTIPYDGSVIGVVSTKPSTLMGVKPEDSTVGTSAENLSKNENEVAVALQGRVPVKITNENGPIRRGDYLTSSSKSGYAMKATKSCVSFGIAMEDFSGEEGEITVFLNLGWYNSQQTDLQGTDTVSLLEINSLKDKDIIIKAGSGKTKIIGELVVSDKLIVEKDIEVKGHIIGNYDTRGVITIPAGETEASFEFDTPYLLDPAVVASPTTKGVLYYLEIDRDKFKIILEQSADIELKFSWMAQQ